MLLFRPPVKTKRTNSVVTIRGTKRITAVWSVALSLVFLIAGCATQKAVKSANKHYIACCDPGLNADDKDKCKWLHEKDRTALIDRYGDTYQGVWDGCKPGEEPWREWE